MDPRSELCQVLDGLPTEYHVYRVRCRSGKLRRIEAPNPALKLAQQTLLHELLYRLRPHEAAHGFVPGRSVVSHATPHAGKAWVVTLDIRDFFQSTGARAVSEVLSGLIELSVEERASILNVVTRRGALPQGAPTSPHLANLAFHGADVALEEFAGSRDLRYTRYADDLTFSGDRLASGLVDGVGAALERFGYRLAAHKTRVMGRHTRQMVTGLVVNERVRLTRELRRWLRAVQHDVRERGLDAALESGESEARLRGYLGLLEMVEPDHLARELQALEQALELG